MVSPFWQCNTPTVNIMPKRSPVSGEYRRTAAPTEFRVWKPHIFIRKLGVMLYSNK